jgi:predicted metalloprotease
MRWESGRRSDNVEDRRGAGLRRGAVGGGAILVALVAALLGAPPETIRQILGGGGPVVTDEAGRAPRSPEEDRLADFSSVVLGYTEDAWGPLFAARGRRYEPPKMRLFTGATESACGFQQSAVGPFYCPPDRRIYLDLEFFSELDRRFGAPGDFAQAYVIAHEVGHHVQNLIGISERAHAQRSRLPAAAANRLSVKVELQADCLAGVWAHYAQNVNTDPPLLEPGDVDEGLRAASAIGDDTLQRRARGHVSPDSFTHGTSAQRQRWFKQGMTSGRMESCDTFAAGDL